MNIKDTSLRIIAPLFTAASLLLSATAQASLITETTTGITNHPDSQLARTGAPGYGLRLNGYFLEPKQAAKYTFDFEHAQSDIALYFDGSQYSIIGSLYGGLSREYETNYIGGESLWALEWYMIPGINCPQDYQRCTVNGHGTLYSEEYGLYQLTAKAKLLPNDESFEFAFIERFRGFNASTGWGWMNWLHADSGRRGSGDFMFVKVPEPGTLGILAIGLAALVSARRASH